MKLPPLPISDRLSLHAMRHDDESNGALCLVARDGDRTSVVYIGLDEVPGVLASIYRQVAAMGEPDPDPAFADDTPSEVRPWTRRKPRDE